MKISDKLFQKYAVPTVILPPPPEAEEEVVVPPSTRVPEISDPSEQEMKDWEDFIAEKKLQKELDITKEISDLGEEEKAGREEGTIPAVPKKKASLSPDKLLVLCDRYYELAKL